MQNFLKRFKNTYIPKLRFKEFLNEKILLKKLDEIFILKNGYTPSKKNKLFWTNGNIPWFRIDDIRTNGQILSDSLLRTTTFAIKKNGLFKKNSVILSTTATVGLHAFIKKDFICNQQLTSFQIKDIWKKKINSLFVFYYFYRISNWCKKNIRSASFPVIEIKDLKKQNFWFCNINEQNKIITFFSLLDQQISLLENKLQLIEQIIKYLLSFKLSYTNKKISDEFYLFDGFPFKSTDYDDNGEKEILTIKNIGVNKLELKKINKTNKIIEDKYEINKNEIICSLTGAAGFKFSLSDSNYYFNQRTLKIIPKKNDFHQILMLLLLFRKNKDFISNLATGSQQNISKKDIKNLNFLKNDSRNIFIARILSKIDKYVNLLISLKELKIKRKNYYLKKIFL